ncbi:hypothetical protein [Paenibacillus sp. JDR-2]|uniref:hypothetical protein n=1 Tax=Paenibacillus sp. (strain JDR-2) TaxID=324057 RepID=UPI0001666AA7|nr:hypothetical protein [Paenibacillus sp. JDR-2]ACT03174.1 hypothetical protein Pjdr2_4557 [Paenibacillus sp. JDR-2]
MRGRRLLIVVILIIAIAVIVFFRTYDGKPGPLPSVDEIIEELNEYDSEANAAVVLDNVKLTEQQFFIPFVSSQGIHGMGFLKWEKRKWSVARVDISGRPEVRVTDHSDPSGRYVVWNNNPLEKVKEFRFYLIRDRNAGMSNGVYYYVPRVQMEMLVNVTEHPYGAMPFPDEWAGIMREDNKLGKAPAANIMDHLFSQSYSQSSTIYVGYLPVYANDASELGSSSKSGDEDTEFLMIMNETDLERP